MPDMRADRLQGSPGLLQGPRPWRILRRRWKRIAVSLGLLSFVLTHVYVVIAGIESYPLTCAGMFAEQVTPATPRYVMQLTGDDGQGGEPYLVPFSDIGASRRNFFIHAYGSASPNTCHPYFANDTPEAFSKRVSDWFAGFMRTWTRKFPDKQPPQRLTLWLIQIYPQQATPKPVLRYRVQDHAIELRPDVHWPDQLIASPDSAGGDA